MQSPHSLLFLAYLLHAIHCFLTIIWQILDGNSAGTAIFLTGIWQNITPGKKPKILLEITLCACYGASHGALLRWHIGTGLLPRDELSGDVCRRSETLRSRVCGKLAEPGKPERRPGIVPKPRFASPSRERTVEALPNPGRQVSRTRIASPKRSFCILGRRYVCMLASFRIYPLGGRA